MTEASASTAPTVYAESVDEVQSMMREAVASATPLRIAGAQSWSAGGPALHAGHVLSLRPLAGISMYVPGDLTITAFAGTSLAELSHATAAHGQWLGLDPAGERHGTIGATIATASCGPLAHAFGTPRDLVLGLEAVTGYGEIVRPGGRVVKNVAGFDLVRLFTGSAGTLGPITAITLRLRAVPVHDVTLAIALEAHATLPTLLQALRQPTLSLLACEWVDGATAHAFGVSDGRDIVLVRCGGSDGFVRGQVSALRAIAACTPCDPAIWGRLSQLDATATAVIRVSGSVTGVPARIARLRQAIHAGGVQLAMHATLSRGLVRVIVTGEPHALRAALQARHDGEQRIPERLPSDWWADEPDPFAVGLAGRIRRAFDPHALCNRRITANE